MAGRAVGYVITLIVTAYLFLVYDDTVINGFLVLELIYPVLSFLYLRMTAGRMEFRIRNVPPMVELGQKILLVVEVRSRSVFGAVKYRMPVKIENRFSGKERGTKYAGTALRGRHSVRLEFLTEECAVEEIRLDTAVVYDFLGIFGRRIPVSEGAAVRVFPKPEAVPVEITRRTREFPADAQEYSSRQSGDDPSEIYQIREYRERDPVRSIHWKMSAKEDKLMVKELGRPLGCTVLLRLELSDAGRDGRDFGRMVERLVSLSAVLIEENCVHMAAWYEPGRRRVAAYRLRKEEALYEMLWELLSAQPVKDREEEQNMLAETFRGVEFAAVVSVGKDGYRVKGELQELLRL